MNTIAKGILLGAGIHTVMIIVISLMMGPDAIIRLGMVGNIAIGALSGFAGADLIKVIDKKD